MRSNISYIGQRRVVNSLAGYTLGDAQIDAQNRTTDAIGQVGAAYSAVKSAGQLTVAYIQGAMDQISGLIAAYDHQYGSTSRGHAGTVTLTAFVTQNIFPTMQSDLTSVANAGGTPVPTVPGGLNPGSSAADPTIPYDFNPNPNYNITINPSGNSTSTPGDTAPSQSPGPPSGIVIPGTSVDVTAAPFAWYENPAILALIGLGLFVFIGGKKGGHS